MPYELIELTTANVVGVYASEGDALRDVAETVRLYGPEAVATLALGFDDYPNSPGRAIADGPELAALAARVLPDGRARRNGSTSQRPAQGEAPAPLSSQRTTTTAPVPIG
jgi:hypothetical protein